jgi:integrase
MKDELARIRSTEVGSLASHAERVKHYVDHSVSDNTKRTYQSAWNHFEEWCKANRIPSLPATSEAVAAYLAWCADTAKPATVALRKTAISKIHAMRGFEDPCYHPGVKAVLKGMYRLKGRKQKQAQAMSIASLEQIDVALSNDDIADVRDKAMILLGFACALRRSELVDLTVEDLDFGTDGLRVFIARSKTDQEGQGVWLGVHRADLLCPVRAVDRWLELSGVTTGRLFRSITQGGKIGESLSDRSVVAIIRGALKRAQISGSALYSGHSLRAGLATAAAEQGRSVLAIMAQTRHTDVKTLTKYIRKASVLTDNVTDILP